MNIWLLWQDISGYFFVRVEVINLLLQWHKEGHFYSSCGAPGFAAQGCCWSSKAVLGLLHKASMEKIKPAGESWGRITHSFPSFLWTKKNPFLWPWSSPWLRQRCHLQQPELTDLQGLAGQSSCEFALCLFWFRYLKLISGSFSIFLKAALYWVASPWYLLDSLFSLHIPWWPAQKLVKLWGLFRAELDNKMVYWLVDS